MSPPPFTERKFELLATAVALVLAFYSLRASFISTAFRELFSSSDIQLPLATALVVNHSGMVAAAVAVVAAITLWAIWSSHRLGALVAAAGIFFLGIGAQLLSSAAIAPVMKIISLMGEQ